MTQVNMPECDKSSILEETLESFVLSTSDLQLILEDFSSELQVGAERDGARFKMIPSFVHRVPSGDESGSFLAVDFGGTNLRVCYITLDGHRGVHVHAEKESLPQHIRTATGSELFSHIAGRIEHFLKSGSFSPSTLSKELPCAFTFSYPVHQTSLNVGSLIAWTKGFEISGVIGRNVVELLQSALDQKELPCRVHVAALLNDTVGTLLAHAYKQPATRIGVIIGTGTNAAFLAPLEALPKYKPTQPNKEGIIVNIEWGNFDSAYLKKNEFDIEIDRTSPNYGEQQYEKMISGYYLGELVRLALVKLSHAQVLPPMSKDTKMMLSAPDISDIDADTSPNLDITANILRTLGFEPTSLEHRCYVKSVVKVIVDRAARLAAVGMCAVLKLIKSDIQSPIVIAIDGSIWMKFSNFQLRVRTALQELLGDHANSVVLEDAMDGSGVGAAVVASLAVHPRGA